MASSLMGWDLIGKTLKVLQECTAVHFFNEGKSAFLVLDNTLYAYGDEHACMVINKKNNSGSKIGGAVCNPIKIMDLPEGVKAIATGEQHAMLLNNCGAVYGWGANLFGELGDGSLNPRIVPYLIKQLPTIKQISCGKVCTLVLDEMKEVWFWGTLFKSEEFKIERVPIRLTLPNHIGASQISIGNGFASIVSLDNKVFTWGNNDCGQLGMGHRNIMTKPSLVPGMKKVTAVLCAANSAIFLNKDGSIFVTGRTGQSVNHIKPKEVTFCQKIVSISANWSSDQFGVRDDKGLILRWGYHDSTGLPRATTFKNIQEIYANKCSPMIYSKDASDISENGFITVQKTPDAEISENVNKKNAKNNSSKKVVHDTSVDCVNPKLNRSYIENWCDVNVRLSDGTCFRAHSKVLSDSCIYLATLIGMDKKEINLSSFDPATCRTFFKYLYTKKLDDVSIKNVPDLLKLSLPDKTVIEKCCLIWKKGLTVRNVLSMYTLAHKHDLEILKHICIPVIMMNFDSIIKSEEFNHLPEEIKPTIFSTIFTEQIKHNIARSMGPFHPLFGRGFEADDDDLFQF